VAASNNRDHAPRSLYYCLFAPLIYGCCCSCTFRLWWTVHSVQRQWRGCNNIPSFLQRTAPIACSFCEGRTWHDLHILVIAPFCCDQKALAACAQSFALWQHATIEIMCRDHSYCLFTPLIYWFCSLCTFRSWWTVHSVQRQQRGCNTVLHNSCEILFLYIFYKSTFQTLLYMKWNTSTDLSILSSSISTV